MCDYISENREFSLLGTVGFFVLFVCVCFMILTFGSLKFKRFFFKRRHQIAALQAFQRGLDDGLLFSVLIKGLCIKMVTY